MVLSVYKTAIAQQRHKPGNITTKKIDKIKE